MRPELLEQFYMNGAFNKETTPHITPADRQVKRKDTSMLAGIAKLYSVNGQSYWHYA